jgi:hypothetical protein
MLLLRGSFPLRAVTPKDGKEGLFRCNWAISPPGGTPGPSTTANPGETPPSCRHKSSGGNDLRRLPGFAKWLPAFGETGPGLRHPGRGRLVVKRACVFVSRRPRGAKGPRGPRGPEKVLPPFVEQGKSPRCGSRFHQEVLPPCLPSPKTLGVAVYELLGGPTRRRIRVCAHAKTAVAALKEEPTGVSARFWNRSFPRRYCHGPIADRARRILLWPAGRSLRSPSTAGR